MKALGFLLFLASWPVHSQVGAPPSPSAPATAAVTTPAGATEDVSRWPKVVMPAGQLSAGARVSVKPLANDETVFVANSGGDRPLKSAAATDYVQVEAIHDTKIEASDQTDMQAMAKNGSLRIATADLKTGAICSGSGSSQSCQLKTDLAVSVASPTNPTSVITAATTPSVSSVVPLPSSGSPPSAIPTAAAAAAANGAPSVRVTSVPTTPVTPAVTNADPTKALVAGMTPTLTNTKSTNGGVSRASAANCPLLGGGGGGGNAGRGSAGGSTPNTNSADPSPMGSPTKCALRLAQQAYKKAKASGKVTEDVMVINDFSTGAQKGKMHFVNGESGSPTFVGTANPIDVARGVGGFGRGGGSFKTPNGAIATLPYKPPRAGNIKDGIELTGLEPGENDDINGRGVLLHGWNPNSSTHGCMGVEGTLTTASRRAVFGQNLDILKRTLFSKGRVLIYNFTPKEAAKCFQDVASIPPQEDELPSGTVAQFLLEFERLIARGTVETEL